MPILDTPHLILRDMVRGDWPAIQALLTDREVTRYMHFGAWTDPRRREWFAWCIANSREAHPDADNWAITLRAGGAVIGWLGVGGSSEPSVPGERDFGYALLRQYWGQGYMTEALQALVALEMETRGTPRLVGECEVENVASGRVMEKAGMRYEGVYDDVDLEGNRALRRRYALHAHEYGAAARPR